MFSYTLVFLLAAFACLNLTPWVTRLAVSVRAIDHPEPRRVHSAPTPRFGGIAVFASLAIGLGLSLLVYPPLRQYCYQVAMLMLAPGAVMLLGLADDCFSVRPLLKLLVEVLIALAAFLIRYRITQVLGWHLGWGAAPVTVLWIVTVANAFNLIDGLDGLATGIGAIISATLFALCLYNSQAPSALVLAASCGSLFGFLRYNFFPAKVFLGDSGSLLLGFIFGLVSIRIADKSSAALAIYLPILALGLPLAEMMLTIIRRLLQVVHVIRCGPDGKHYEFFFLGRAAVFTADKSHIHHRLLDLGITHRNAVLLLYGVCSLLCGAALVLIFRRGAEEGLILGLFAVAAVIGVRRLGYREFQLLRNGLLLPFLDAPIFSLKPFQVLLDIASITAAYLSSYLLSSLTASTMQLTPAVLHALPFVCLGQLAGFAIGNPYRESYRFSRISDLIALIKTLAVAEAVGWTACFVVFGWQSSGLVIMVLDTYLLGTMVITWRFSFLVLEHYFQIADEPYQLQSETTRRLKKADTESSRHVLAQPSSKVIKHGAAGGGDGL